MFKMILNIKCVKAWILFSLICCICSGCTEGTQMLQEKKSNIGSKHNNLQGPGVAEQNAGKPSLQSQELEKKPSKLPSKENIRVKALYLTGWTVGSPSKRKSFIDLANTTELNSFVVDIKDDDGMVGYASGIPAVREAGTWMEKYNVDEVLQEFHANNIHVIGRIVCFKDPAYSARKPELAVQHINGGLWKEKKGSETTTWLNPYKKETWPYLVDIAKEAVNKGFDEIQFDYVRFPNGDRSQMDFGENTMAKHEAINEFLAYARKELPDVVLSADVFGIICESPGDREDIGQYFELIGKNLDYISPMTYPSLYARGQIVNKITFPKPDLEPYRVVYNTLLRARDRIAKTPDYMAQVRPYLQGYTANWMAKGDYQIYGPEQYQQQINAVYDAGYEQWIFWDANNRYSGAYAFQKTK